MKLQPTQEQQTILRCVPTTNIMTINASAGTGKTTSLVMVSETFPKKSLFLAFGTGNRDDALERFPSHVEVRTTHSVAYRAIGHAYNHKLQRPKTKKYVNGVKSGGEIARYFGLRPVMDRCGKWITSAYIGLLIRKTVERFEQSDFERISDHHVPQFAFKNGINGQVLQYAKELWKLRINKASSVLISPDTYMKLFQLSKPKLNYDVIYLDEAQDTSACTLDIVMRQKDHAKIIIVGDKYQGIFGWRGSINAMEIVQGDNATLSESFRFGQNLSDLANKIVGNNILRSSPSLHTEVGVEDIVDRSTPYTVLYRTNMALLTELLDLVEDGYSVTAEVSVGDLCTQLEQAKYLYAGNTKKVKHENLIMFATWGDLVDESKSNPELSRLRTFIETPFMADKVIRTLKQHRNHKNAHITLTTAHKSKGREWDQVILAEDFPSNFDNKGNWVGLSDEERNTLYVAATRGRKAVEYNTTVAEIFHTNNVKGVSKC